ncbi:MAG: hypothetical protein WCE23_08065, partial [Candidatus Binatus sp.]|uniref:hypothetical protein n=1 Tax=Candidatus Binatus sp. TaxID=2811406 RepID=UPI003C78A578
HTVYWLNQTVYNTSGGPGGTSPYYLDTDNLPTGIPPQFNGTSNTSQSITWQSLGGLVELAALTEIGEGTLGDGLVADCANILAVTGANMGTNAQSTITPTLENDYSGVTNDLMTGVAAVESTYQQFGQFGSEYDLTFNFQPSSTFYDIFPYLIPTTADATGWWPNENSLGGSAIGLMQVGPPLSTIAPGVTFSGYLDAWDWTVNANDAIKKLFPAKIQTAMNIEAAARGLTRNQLPALSASQREDNALVCYAGRTCMGSSVTNIYNMHWAPCCKGRTLNTKNAKENDCPSAWTWKPQSPLNPFAINPKTKEPFGLGPISYSYCVRYCTESIGVTYRGQFYPGNLPGCLASGGAAACQAAMKFPDVTSDTCR